MFTQTMLGPGVGPYFTPIKCIVYNRTDATVALGDVLMLDHASVSNSGNDGDKSALPNSDLDSSNKCWPLANAIVPTARGIGTLSGASPTPDSGSILGVVTSLMQGAGADNTKIELTLFGVVTAAFAGSTNFGASLSPGATVKTLTATITAGTRVVAKSIAPDSTTGSGLVIFNGLGFASALVAS